jgi:Flp pilus assembly protein TadG
MNSKALSHVSAGLFRRVRNLLRDDRGVSAVLVALLMSALLVVASFTIDLGSVYLESARLQHAADAAALAAAGRLPIMANDSARIAEIRSMAVSYAAKNGLTLQNSDIALGTDGTPYILSVTVTGHRTVNMNLAGIIGIDTVDLAKSAEARIGVASSVGGAVPLSIEKTYLQNCITAGTTRHLTLKFGGGSGTNGFFGLVDLDGSNSGGANDIKDWLEWGYPGKVLSGDLIYPVEPGNKSGPCFTAFWNRFARCTHFAGQGGCTIDHFVETCPRVVRVPIIVQQSSKTVKIVGFAGFVLESCNGSGNDNFIVGSFVRILEPAGLSNTVNPDLEAQYGVYTAYLSR